MFKTICLAVAICALAPAATTSTTSAARKKTAKRVVHSAAKSPAKVASKTAVSKSGTVAARSKRGKGVKTKRVTRSYQQAPTPERYKEIQQALASKGYYHGEPNGAWGPDSVDSLKRFQTDQNLTPDGKIGSLSLIALGLGSKRMSAQASSTPPAVAPK